jgi:Ca2+-binding RTX toxin-like protein
VRLDGTDGQSRVFELEDSMVITEDESGNLIAYGAKDGFLIGTAGKDIIISAGHSVYAGDGDDAILILRSSDLFTSPRGIAVDAGNGNDTLVADSLHLASNVNMGDGDDVLQADLVLHIEKNGAIEMGKGNDVVQINRLYGRVSLGEGDDVLVAGLSGGVISGGAGDDILNLGDFSEGNISTGAGNDRINANSMGVVQGFIRSVRALAGINYTPRVTINGDSGTTEINVAEDVKDTFVHGGASRTTLTARNVISSFFHNIQADISGEITSSLLSTTVRLISGQEDIYQNADEKLIKKMYDFAQQKDLGRYLPTDLKI